MSPAIQKWFLHFHFLHLRVSVCCFCYMDAWNKVCSPIKLKRYQLNVLKYNMSVNTPHGNCVAFMCPEKLFCWPTSSWMRTLNIITFYSRRIHSRFKNHLSALRLWRLSRWSITHAFSPRSLYPSTVQNPKETSHWLLAQGNRARLTSGLTNRNAVHDSMTVLLRPHLCLRIKTTTQAAVRQWSVNRGLRRRW